MAWSGQGRRRPILGALLVVTAVAVGLVGCGTRGGSDDGPGEVVDASGTEAIELVREAFAGQDSFTVTGSTVLQEYVVTSEARVHRAGASGVELRWEDSTAEYVVTEDRSTIYFRIVEPTQVEPAEGSVWAAMNAGQWARGGLSNRLGLGTGGSWALPEWYDAMLFDDSDALAALIPEWQWERDPSLGPLVQTDPGDVAQVNGTAAVPLTLVTPGGSATLWVAAVGEPLPVRFESGNDWHDFADWGSAPAVEVPDASSAYDASEYDP